LKKSKSNSVLEKLRISKKEAKQIQQHHISLLKDNSFILPAFKSVQVTPEMQTLGSTGGYDDCLDDIST